MPYKDPVKRKAYAAANSAKWQKAIINTPDELFAMFEVQGYSCPSPALLRAAADYLDPPTEGFKKFLSLYPTSSLSMMK